MKHKAKRCVLHIGVAKTGSTAIQVSLQAGADRLAKAGVLYPSQAQNHKFLVSLFRKNPERLDFHRVKRKTPEKVARLNARARAMLAAEIDRTRPHTLLLSSEHCVLLARDEVAALKSYLESLAEQVQVHAYARHPGYQVSSMMQERIKGGARRISDLRAEPPYVRYQKVLGTFATVFGPGAMHVRAFPGDPPERRDVVQDFLEWTGLWDADNPVASVRANESLSWPAVLIADAMSGFAPKSSASRAGHKYLSQIVGPRLVVDREIMQAVLAVAQPELDYLAREWGLDLPGPPDTPDPADSPEMFGPDTIRAIARVLNDLALEVRQGQKKP